MIRARFYRFAGRALCVLTRDEWSSQVAEQFIGGYRFAPISGALAEAAAMTIEISSDEPPPPAPRDLPAAEIFHGRCRADGATLYLEIDDSLIVVEPPASKVVRLWFGATPQARHPLSIVTALSYAGYSALRRCGLYELHAAGVIAPAGGGALIVGASGSGKTTLTMRLVANGWHYLSDDRLILDEDGGKVTAWGLRRLFAATDQTLAAHPSERLADAAGARAVSDPSKRYLEPDRVFPDGFVQSCEPQALFFASLADGRESSVTEISQSEAMTRLVGQSPWTCYDPAMARDHLDALAQLVKQSRTYRLQAGRDLIEEPDRAARLIASFLN